MDGYGHVKGTIKITKSGADAAVRQENEKSKQVIYKTCALFNNCISKVNNNQVDNTKDLHIVILMYNLIGYSYDIAKTLGNLWKYHEDDPNDNIIDSESFKFNSRITLRTSDAGKTNDVEIAVLLTLFKMGGKKAPYTRFSLVPSTNAGISPKNFLTFSFNLLPHCCKISSFYLVPVPNY